MKVKSAILAFTFIAAMILPISLYAISPVKAPNGYGSWSPIVNTGYAVITNYFGLNVPLGTPVTATAGTTDLTVYQIEFRWHNATGQVIFDDIVPALGPLTTPATPPPPIPSQITSWATNNPGVQYKYAQNTHIPDSAGDWGVQALFYAPGGHLEGQNSDIIAIRATSFNVIPEIPVLGTAGAALAMLLGLGLYKKRKKN